MPETILYHPIGTDHSSDPFIVPPGVDIEHYLKKGFRLKLDDDELKKDEASDEEVKEEYEEAVKKVLPDAPKPKRTYNRKVQK